MTLLCKFQNKDSRDPAKLPSNLQIYLSQLLPQNRQPFVHVDQALCVSMIFLSGGSTIRSSFRVFFRLRPVSVVTLSAPTGCIRPPSSMSVRTRPTASRSGRRATAWPRNGFAPAGGAKNALVDAWFRTPPPPAPWNDPGMVNRGRTTRTCANP